MPFPRVIVRKRTEQTKLKLELGLRIPFYAIITVIIPSNKIINVVFKFILKYKHVECVRSYKKP